MAKRKKPVISAEEFAAWRDDPVTQAVLKAHADMAELQCAGWVAASWHGGECDPLALMQFRTRAEAYRAISECTYADIVGEEE